MHKEPIYIIVGLIALFLCATSLVIKYSENKDRFLEKFTYWTSVLFGACAIILLIIDIVVGISMGIIPGMALMFIISLIALFPKKKKG
ncbi:MAG: hypothetical protein KAR54_03420 [Candidatus Pacebacteria bacterium]|nr:hypothetical protein [Candidatus Paceibacterota bacterium]